MKLEMKVKGYILCVCLALTAVAGYGQKTDRDYLRSGNKLYKDSLFVKAEVDYRKALELNPKSADAMYNLGNALMMQEKAKEAMAGLKSAAGFLRRQLGSNLRLRYAPEIVWALDDSITYGAKMLNLINSLGVKHDEETDES